MSIVVPVVIAQGDHRETNATWAIYVSTKNWFLETSLNKPHLVRLHGDVVHRLFMYVPVYACLLAGANRPSCMASAFLGKYAFITAVDLIQRKKLDFWNFHESNLTEARFDSLPFY